MERARERVKIIKRTVPINLVCADRVSDKIYSHQEGGVIQNNSLKMKVYNFPDFASAFLNFHKDFPALIASLVHRRISRAFESKIMLTVTAVNGCTYCAWFHSKAALQAGLNHNEVKLLLSSQLNRHIDDEDVVALNFAVHYADTDQKPDKELLNNLFEVYGQKTAEDILLRLRMIYFGNLCGNTFKAFLSRVQGRKQENSFWLTELVIFIMLSPLLGPIALLMKKERPGALQ